MQGQKSKGDKTMEDKKVLNDKELEQVSGGTSNITTSRIHTDCGGNVILEDVGTYFEDIYLTCQKCGKKWHPHSYEKLNECDGIFTVTRGSF